MALAATGALVAGCQGEESAPEPPRILSDGTTSAQLPERLDDLGEAVLSRVRVARASQIDAVRLVACEGRLDTRLDPSATVVERTSVDGSSLTFVEPTSGRVAGCDEIPNPFRESDRDPGDPWCAAAIATMDDDRLTDPRMNVCESARGDFIAFAWVEPAASARWIVVDGDPSIVYEVGQELPIRLVKATGGSPTSRASFEVDHYGADGTRIRSSTVEAGVAG